VDATFDKMSIRFQIPVAFGFLGGILAGIASMPFGGMALAMTLPAPILGLLYSEGGAGTMLLTAPLLVMLLFGLIGAATGLVLAVVHALVGRRRDEHHG
jgi:hypothetical protein